MILVKIQMLILVNYDWKNKVDGFSDQMIETIIQEIKQEARTRDIPLSVLEMDLFEA